VNSAEEHIFLPKTHQNAGFWPQKILYASNGHSRREESHLRTLFSPIHAF